MTKEEQAKKLKEIRNRSMKRYEEAWKKLAQ